MGLVGLMGAVLNGDTQVAPRKSAIDMVKNTHLSPEKRRWGGGGGRRPQGCEVRHAYTSPGLCSLSGGSSGVTISAQPLQG